MLLAALLALQAAEPAWQSLGSPSGIATSYDPASVHAEGGKVRVRTRGTVAAAGPDGISSVTGTVEIDCAAGTATPLDARGYDPAGHLVLNAIVPPAERQAQPIRPDSPNAVVRDRVCGAAAR